MKKKIFKTFFKAIGTAISYFFFFIIFMIVVLTGKVFLRCKTKGKNKINKNDEARVFIVNHYEIYGPLITFLKFPYKFRPWVISRMMDPKTIEEQMTPGIEKTLSKCSKGFQKFIIKLVRNFLVFVMKFIKSIPVYRDNPRANLTTMQLSTKVLEKKMAIMIFPELNAVKSGVGEFMTGFEFIGKYYYQKTGKKITFYPVFVSKQNKTMYIEEPIVYNPENDVNEEKKRIVETLHDSMVHSYVKNECSVPYKKAGKLKTRRK